MGSFNSTLTKSLNIFITKVWSDLPPSGLIDYWSNIIETDPQMTNVYLTIDIVFGGNNRYFISTHPIRTTDSNNNVYQYIPLLQSEPTINAQYTIGNPNPSQRSFSISFDSRLLKPTDIIATGQSIAGIAEISLQKDGGEYNNRFIIMRGDMSGGVTMGTNDEILTTDIIDPAYTSDKIVPEVFCSIDTIPTIPDSYIGHRYPLIFDNYPYVPCINTSDTEFGPTFLVCAGHDHVVNNVYINGNEKLSTDNNRGWGAYYSYDKLGNPVTVIKFIVALPSWESGDTVYANVSRVDQSGVSRERNLIEVIKAILIKGSLLTEAGLDADLFGRAEQKLSPLKVKCLINGSGSSDSARCLDYVQNTLCGSFPMLSFTFTGRGYGPIVTDRRNEFIALNLTARQGLLYDRTTDLQESSKSEIKNSFTLKYDYDAVNDNYRKIVTRTASNSGLCRISQQRFGLYDESVTESIVIYDDSVANYVLDWMVSHFTLPSYEIEYSGSPSLIFHLKLGDNIKLTDDQFGFSNQTGTITKVEYQKGQAIIGVKLWLLYETIGESVGFGGASGSGDFTLAIVDSEEDRPNWPGFNTFGDASGSEVINQESSGALVIPNTNQESNETERDVPEEEKHWLYEAGSKVKEFLGSLYSDVRLKGDVRFLGNSPTGVPKYSFYYLSDPEKRIYHGTIGQNIKETHTNAVSIENGFYKVNYSKIDVDFYLIEGEE